VECELSHKICCRRCCCTYIEPRIDADLDFFPDAEASKAAASSPQTQRVGFEPIKIENGVREKLIRVWEENELLLSQAGDASELDNDGGKQRAALLLGGFVVLTQSFAQFPSSR
jgi:hypothetical protein